MLVYEFRFRDIQDGYVFFDNPENGAYDIITFKR